MGASIFERPTATSFIADDAPLQNLDPEHLRSAAIGFLCTNVENSKKDRTVIGTAAAGQPQGAMGKWGRAKATLQVTQWFGMVPDFIITIDAAWWLQASDAEACGQCWSRSCSCHPSRSGDTAKITAPTGLPPPQAWRWFDDRHEARMAKGFVRNH
jgi:hypothetical protein